MSRKVEQLPDSIDWHFIGRIQTNKLKFIAQQAHCVHTISTPKHLAALDRCAHQFGKKIRVLFQVNVGDEETKNGCRVEALPSLMAFASECDALNVCGLMTLPPRGTFGEARQYFSDFAATRASAILVLAWNYRWACLVTSRRVSPKAAR